MESDQLRPPYDLGIIPKKKAHHIHMQATMSAPASLASLPVINSNSFTNLPYYSRACVYTTHASVRHWKSERIPAR
jgi:hypothetical protein